MSFQGDELSPKLDTESAIAECTVLTSGVNVLAQWLTSASTELLAKICLARLTVFQSHNA